MAPRKDWTDNAPPPTQERQSPEHETNPFVAFRRLVDQQFESIFDLILPASRYEDSPFWQRKESPCSRGSKDRMHAPDLPDDRRESFHQQRHELERKMELEIERARQHAFQQLPWLWDAAASKEQELANRADTPRPKNDPRHDVNKIQKAVSPPAAVPSSTNRTNQGGPDSEEEAYLFLNFPHAHDQIHSSLRNSNSPESSANEAATPLSLIGSIAGDSSAMREEYNRERAQTDNLLHTLRQALQGVEPWERARVVEQLPVSRQKEEDELTKARDERLRERHCPVSRRDHVPTTAAKTMQFWDRSWDSTNGWPKQPATQTKEPHRPCDSSERVIKAPWWWMAAVWDPTFPRDAPATVTFPSPRPAHRYNDSNVVSSPVSASPVSHHLQPTIPPMHAHAAITPEPPQDRAWDRNIEQRVVRAANATDGQNEVFTSSLTTITESHPQPDGSVLTRVVMQRRRADGSDERSERVMRQRPGEGNGERAMDGWMMGEGLGMLGRRRRTERGFGERSGPVAREATKDVGRKQEERSRKGWFWAS